MRMRGTPVPVKNSSAPDVPEVSIEWTYVPFDQMPLNQRLAWDWLWRKLLAPPEESYRGCTDGEVSDNANPANG
jgi:hypothetical protein